MHTDKGHEFHGLAQSQDAGFVNIRVCLLGRPFVAASHVFAL